MAEAGRATPPAGFLDFCARNPQDCGLQGAATVTVVQAAAVQPADTPAAAPPARRGGFDWSSAFAAQPAQESGQVAALRQQLYSRYMWQAAFSVATPAPSPVVAEAPTPPPVAPFDPAADAFRASHPYLIKAAYITPMPNAWSQLGGDLALEAPAQPADQAAPAIVEQAQPAAAVAPARQPLAVSKAIMAELIAVDRRINRSIVQTDDVRAYGVDDYWATPLETASIGRGVVRGDCEDYALEKRRALIAAGIPADALSIAVAETRFGPHAVLLVDTDQGELVLDSLSGKIVSWDRTGYRWVKRQAWGDPMSWVEIAQAN